ncbi:hypothetical protein E2C01_052179 [Portunus trituberculatus]|uniref:Uncharacterized protein n=1 Tax=Portunus trituberculatus TaxID=210409 RepID=A0A5B7GNP9_PORTR|nr:hypothetical protein [Portunus trituberculatus]
MEEPGGGRRTSWGGQRVRWREGIQRDIGHLRLEEEDARDTKRKQILTEKKLYALLAMCCWLS